MECSSVKSILTFYTNQALDEAVKLLENGADDQDDTRSFAASSCYSQCSGSSFSSLLVLYEENGPKTQNIFIRGTDEDTNEIQRGLKEGESEENTLSGSTFADSRSSSLRKSKLSIASFCSDEWEDCSIPGDESSPSSPILQPSKPPSIPERNPRRLRHERNYYMLDIEQESPQSAPSMRTELRDSSPELEVTEKPAETRRKRLQKKNQRTTAQYSSATVSTSVDWENERKTALPSIQSKESRKSFGEKLSDIKRLSWLGKPRMPNR